MGRNLEDGLTEEFMSPLGILKQRIFSDGEWIETWDEPSWDYIYDEYDNGVTCPICGESELRYHNGQACCLSCDSTFTDQEIEDYAGPWHV